MTTNAQNTMLRSHNGGQAPDHDQKMMPCGIKTWIQSLSFKELLDAMVFPIASTSNEYDLLIEMLNNQSPPPTPIHPRAIGYPKPASNKPVTDGRWTQEHRLLRARFEKPRLFQFIERITTTNDDYTAVNDIYMTGLGLPDDIAALLKEDRKNNLKTKGTRSIKKKLHTKRAKKEQKFDVIAKKFNTPWGDVYSLGSTKIQREADLKILLGSQFQYGATKVTCQQGLDCYGHFYPQVCFHSGSIHMDLLLNKEDVLKMLHIASRGKFLSVSPRNDQIHNSNGVPFCAPWFDPTQEWFSLPLYLASRFEAALWSSFNSSMFKNQSFGLPLTVIEHTLQSVSTRDFIRHILKSVNQSIKIFLSNEISTVEGKVLDLCIYQLLMGENTLGFVPYEEMIQVDIIIKSLVSIPLVHLGKSRDTFRKQIVLSLEQVVREETEKSLIDSCPPIRSLHSIQNEKLRKKNNRRKKKMKRKKQSITSHKNMLNSIEENNDDISIESNDHNEDGFNTNSISNGRYRNDNMFILEIIEEIYTKTFHELGFENDDEGLMSKVVYHKVEKSTRDESSFVLKRPNRKLSKNSGNELAVINPSNMPLKSLDCEMHDNQMTMKRSNVSVCWNKAISQPAFDNARDVHDFFKPDPNNINIPKASYSILDESSTNYSHAINHNIFNHQQKYLQSTHYDVNNAINQNNFCLDSAFDRIEQSLIHDLFDTEQRKQGQDSFASSTAASIASSILDLDNDQDTNLHLTSHKEFDDELTKNNTPVDVKIEEIDSDQSNIIEPENFSYSDASFDDKEEGDEKSSLLDVAISTLASKSEKDQSEQDITDDDNACKASIKSTPDAPVLVSLAELGEYRKLAQKEHIEPQEKSNVNQVPSTIFSAISGSPKAPRRSWSREDLRITLAKDDNHYGYRFANLQGYQVAKSVSRRTPSICSHEINSNNRKQVESIRFARSVSSLKALTNEIIIDGSLHLCAQSESALDEPDDSSHWNVIPRIGLDDDGATTISSIPSTPLETDEVTSLREERDAYRDMCLTLGSEIAKLKNLLALVKLSSSLSYVNSDTSSFDFPNTQVTFGHGHASHFHHTRNRSLDNNIAKSDIGIHNDAQISEDGTDIFHESVTATEASGKYRTINSNSIGNMMLSSISGGIAGSDMASFDHDTGFSGVFNPPTSTFILRRESFGPLQLHGLQSRLGRDMTKFLSSVTSQLDKNSNKRELARKRLTMLVTTLWPRAQVKIYGSHVTGLCLPSSDLDFVICLPAVHKNTPADTPGALEGRNAINESNQKLLARKLKSESWIDPLSIKIIERTAVPVIKVSTKDTRSKSLQLDISFDAPEHHGLLAIEMVTDTMTSFPMVKPLVLVLKQFLFEKSLLTAYTGGLSSYCLFLMVTKYLQESSYHGWPDPGVYLMGFLDFYGNHFDPRLTGISIKKNRYFNRRHTFQDRNTPESVLSGEFTVPQKYPPSSLNPKSLVPTRPFSFDPLYVEDPISQGNNVGRNAFRISQVQRSFSDAHRALMASLEWDMNSTTTDVDEDCPLLKCLIQRNHNA